MIQFFIRFYIVIFSLILIYVIFRSDGLTNFIIRKDNLIVCGILISLIIFFYFLINFRSIIQEYTIITITSIILSLYLYEGFIHFQNYKKIRIIDEQKIKNNFDTRTVYQVYKDEKELYDNVVLSMSPINQIDDKEKKFIPLSGISFSKTISCNENGYYFIYDSDRYGFNNPDKEWDNKNIDYVLIGDSFVHGACVNRPNDIASRLRKLSKNSVLNLGYGGNGPLLEFATLREYLNPGVSKVLWFYFEGNDNINLKNELNIKLLNRYLDDLNFTQNLKLYQNRIDNLLAESFKKELILEEKSLLKNKEQTKNRISYSQIIKFVKLGFTRKLLYHTEPIPNNFKRIIKLTNELVKMNNSKLYFIYLPSFERYKFKTLNFGRKDEVKKIITDLRIDFIDIDDEIFKKEKDPLKLFPFEKHGHYTVQAYNKISMKIYEKTKQN